MQLGMIGLGRMGANMVRRLMRAGHSCVVFDVNPGVVDGMVKEGAVGASSLQELVDKLTTPRVTWMMVPAALVDQTLASLVPLLDTGDITIDGGNSYYHDDVRPRPSSAPRAFTTWTSAPAAGSGASNAATA